MKKYINEKELLELIKINGNQISFSGKVFFTPLALDLINSKKIKITFSQNQTKPENDNTKVIAIGSDHTGFATKNEVKKFLETQGYKIIDVGTFNDKACDYPDSAFDVARLVQSGQADRGILFDATGNPSAICANKVNNIRAAVAINEYNIISSREHNNANVLSIGARIFANDFIISLIKLWLKTKFLGDRHQLRLDKITRIEKELTKK